MLGIDKNTVENLVILICGVLIFNSIVNFPKIGEYFVKYPVIILIIAIILLVLKDKIADKLGQ